MNNFQFELPAYAHIPGKTPHPISNPAGHSYGVDEPEQADLEFNLRRGLFLFENQYFWEAHEAWEQAWIALDRKGTAADFVKGFIKLAASGVKCLEGNRTGAKRHLLRAKELLRGKNQTAEEELQEWLPEPTSLIEAMQRSVSSLL